jgi:hypothetical protein
VGEPHQPDKQTEDIKMKAIKITAKNLLVIQAALVKVNGKACAHTFSAGEIIDVAEHAEFELLNLMGNKKDAVGATVFARSGNKLPNAYKYSRQVNKITIERRSSGWWLVYVGCYETWDKSGSRSSLTLTAAQDAKAVARFKKVYQVK